MMINSLFSHSVMVVISIGIIVTFVEPTFGALGEMQDDLAVYQSEQSKVSQLNNQLNSLVSVLNEVTPDNQRRLLTYMPDEVDTISVLRDLSIITNRAGLIFISAGSDGQVERVAQQEEGTTNEIHPKEYGFRLSVEGEYNQFKNLFSLLEQNNYPIEVQNIVVQKKDGGFLLMDVSLSVYAYEDNASPEAIVF